MQPWEVLPTALIHHCQGRGHFTIMDRLFLSEALSRDCFLKRGEGEEGVILMY